MNNTIAPLSYGSILDDVQNTIEVLWSYIKCIRVSNEAPHKLMINWNNNQQINYFNNITFK